MSIYMIGMIRNSEAKVFNRALIQGCVIAFVVFMLFAWGGETILVNISMYVLRLSNFWWTHLFGDWLSLCVSGADTIGDARRA
jgi:hypothetical protein